MAYDTKNLSCDLSKLKGLSEKLIVNHYENNHGGCVEIFSSGTTGQVF
jgi:superoxide dismutase, Fe-Mn family